MKKPLDAAAKTKAVEEAIARLPKSFQKSNIMHAFVLNEKNEPVGLTDAEFVKWAMTHDDFPQRAVARAEINGYSVLTDFVGSDMSCGRRPIPLTFETIIYRGPKVIDTKRYCTWDEAEKGHAETVKELQGKRRRKK
jgi:hypothetical protein